MLMRFCQVDKHAQREQILEKLREGAAFDALAREFSQDKARQGKGRYAFLFLPLISLPPLDGGEETRDTTI